MQILKRHAGSDPLDALGKLTDRDDILEIQNYVGSIKMSDDLLGYMVALCERTRRHDRVELGLSPRGLLALSRMSRACAILSGRDYVVPNDVRTVFVDVCAHRLILRPRARLEGITAKTILEQILEVTPRPSIGK